MQEGKESDYAERVTGVIMLEGKESDYAEGVESLIRVNCCIGAMR